MTREQRLFVATTIFLVIYIPVETYISLPNLLSPFYLVDVAGMVLLTWGVLRRRTATGPLLLIAGYAWSGANGWRAMADRLRFAAANQNGWTEADTTRIAVVGIVLILLAGLGMLAAIRVASTRERSAVSGV